MQGQTQLGINKIISAGKTIIVIANLEPAKIAGIESQGMLLAVEDKDGKYSLLTTDKEVETGKRAE